jgi:hypothetical protein
VQFLTPIRPQKPPPPGNSVEWIVEAPKIGGFVQRPPDFGAVSFYSACYVPTFVLGGSNTCEPISAGTQSTQVDLHQSVFGYLQILADPDTLTENSESSAFDDYYVQPVRCPNC